MICGRYWLPRHRGDQQFGGQGMNKVKKKREGVVLYEDQKRLCK